MTIATIGDKKHFPVYDDLASMFILINKEERKLFIETVEKKAQD